MFFQCCLLCSEVSSSWATGLSFAKLFTDHVAGMFYYFVAKGRAGGSQASGHGGAGNGNVAGARGSEDGGGSARVSRGRFLTFVE